MSIIPNPCTREYFDYMDSEPVGGDLDRRFPDNGDLSGEMSITVEGGEIADFEVLLGEIASAPNRVLSHEDRAFIDMAEVYRVRLESGAVLDDIIAEHTARYSN